MTLPPGKQATIIICFIKKKSRRREIYCKFRSKDESNKTVDDITGQYNGKNRLNRKKGSGRPVTAWEDAKIERNSYDSQEVRIFSPVPLNFLVWARNWWECLLVPRIGVVIDHYHWFFILAFNAELPVCSKFQVVFFQKMTQLCDNV